MKKLYTLLALAVCSPIGSAPQAASFPKTSYSVTSADTLKQKGNNSSSLKIVKTENDKSESNEEKNCTANCSQCNTSTEKCISCRPGYYLNNGKCVSCPTNASCSNGTTFSCNDLYYQSGNSCVGICERVVCKSGYKAVAKNNSCCCEIDTEGEDA